MRQVLFFLMSPLILILFFPFIYFFILFSVIIYLFFSFVIYFIVVHKPGGRRQIPYNLTFKWNLVNKTNKWAKQNQGHGNKEQTEREVLLHWSSRDSFRKYFCTVTFQKNWTGLHWCSSLPLQGTCNERKESALLHVCRVVINNLRRIH